MNSIALFGFANPESLRLVTSLSVLDPSLRFINFTSETNKDKLDSGVQCALIWAAGAGLSGLSGLVNTAADAGLPVVVIMLRECAVFQILGIVIPVYYIY